MWKYTVIQVTDIYADSIYIDTLLTWDKSYVGCHPISKIEQMTPILNKTPFAITIWPLIYVTCKLNEWNECWFQVPKYLK